MAQYLLHLEVALFGQRCFLVFGRVRVVKVVVEPAIQDLDDLLEKKSALLRTFFSAGRFSDPFRGSTSAYLCVPLRTFLKDRKRTQRCILFNPNQAYYQAGRNLQPGAISYSRGTIYRSGVCFRKGDARLKTRIVYSCQGTDLATDWLQ
jgi:hypothetical protein